MRKEECGDGLMEIIKKIKPGEKIRCTFDKNSVTGTLKIGNDVFNVYLGDISAEMINLEQLFKVIRKFTLIEY